MSSKPESRAENPSHSWQLDDDAEVSRSSSLDADDRSETPLWHQVQRHYEHIRGLDKAWPPTENDTTDPLGSATLVPVSPTSSPLSRQESRALPMVNESSPEASKVKPQNIDAFFTSAVTQTGASEPVSPKPQKKWWQRTKMRQFVMFVTLPGVTLGTVSLATAYGTGLIGHSKPATCTSTTSPAPAKDSFAITVMNATGKDGLGGQVSTGLKKRGFIIKMVTSAPSEMLSKAPAVIYYGSDSFDQALYVKQQVKGAELYFDGRKGKDVTFVIGSEYTDLVPAPPPRPPNPDQVVINVINANWDRKYGGVASEGYAARGFKIAKAVYGAGRDYPNDTAIIRFGEEAEPAAKLVAKHVAGAQLAPVTRDGKEVDVILGSKFKGLLKVNEVPADKPLPPEKPATIDKPCSTGT